MAEYLLRSKLGAGADWDVLSAGLSGIDGMLASGSAVAVLVDCGVDASSHRSRHLTKELVEAASVIVVMTEEHRRQIELIFPYAAEKVFLLGSFADDASNADVEDPMGNTREVYAATCDQIEACLPGLMDFLKHLDLKT